MRLRPPTDFELLKAIYDRHLPDYRIRSAEGVYGRVFVPVDIPAVADDLGTNADSVFGRLYHHLEQVYGEKHDPTNRLPRKAFFHPQLGPRGDSSELVNAINFPLMEAVLASLWQERDRDRRTYWTAILSIVIASGSLALSILVATGVL